MRGSPGRRRRRVGVVVTAAVLGTSLVALAVPAAAAEGLAPIGPGYSDNARGVECVQDALGVPLGGAAPGTYGQASYGAVVVFQTEVGLPTTGAVGPRTGDALVASGRMAPGCAEHVPTSAGTGAPESPQVAEPDDRAAPGVSPACVAGSRDAAAEIAETTRVENEVTTIAEAGNDAAVVTLRYSPDTRCAWAWIGGVWGSTVWVDRRSSDGTEPLGPELPRRSIQSGNENTYGAAVPLPVDTELRACGQVRDEVPTCTLWFDGSTTTTDDRTGGPAYVALGDSFSSGEGAGEYVPSTDVNGVNLCHRSKNAYGVLVGRALTMPPIFGACSGATIDDYWGPQEKRRGQPPQRDLLSRNAQLVTLTMGGNDIGFVEVAKNCALNKINPFDGTPGDATCQERIEEAASEIPSLAGPSTDRSTLTSVVVDIHRKAPDARILVLGYPRVFPAEPEEACAKGAPGVRFLKDEMGSMNDLVDDLNARISTVVDASGVEEATYVDVGGALRDHELCGAEEAFINGLFNPVSASIRNQSYHPNSGGHRALAARVEQCRENAGTCGPPR